MNNPALGQQSYGFGPLGPGMSGTVMGLTNQGPVPSTTDPYDPYGKRPENQATVQQQQGHLNSVNAEGGNWQQAQNWQRVRFSSNC